MSIERFNKVIAHMGSRTTVQCLEGLDTGDVAGPLALRNALVRLQRTANEVFQAEGEKALPKQWIKLGAILTEYLEPSTREWQRQITRAFYQGEVFHLLQQHNNSAVLH